MEIQIQQLFGIWRNENGNVITDFNIHQFDNNHNMARAMFTIYNPEKDNKIIYEWHGKFGIINYQNELSKIEFNEIFKSEDLPQYENIRIWTLDNSQLIIALGNGERIIFNKL
ncbi:hypothetical protein [Flavobacterium sp. SM2513]|uniref:hypothetical protein n=1 Tax=Flavobacterium sp. SM2513 TaxID=3424766 RepID=UPI003D7F73AF